LRASVLKLDKPSPTSAIYNKYILPCKVEALVSRIVTYRWTAKIALLQRVARCRCPKIEMPKPGGRPKAKARRTSPTRTDSDFGLRPSFGFRTSDFGFVQPGL